MIWVTWMDAVCNLRSAFSREKSFLWFIVTLLGFSVRADHFGISSIIRALGMRNKSYECLRQFFRSSAVDLAKLTLQWKETVEYLLKNYLHLFKGKKVYIIDGIKAAKEGRRMAGVKWLFQGSQNNSKPRYIFGHSCQALHVLVKASKSYLAIPLIMRIHEGFNSRRGSVVMRILDLVLSLRIKNSYIVGDAYYWAGELSQELKQRGNHLISRVRMNANAYLPPISGPKKVGRPKKYGDKKKLKNFFKGKGFIQRVIELYGKNEEILYKEKILVCKNHQSLIKYVFVKHGGTQCIFSSTDLSLSGLEIIQLYSYRFKIEFSFKEFVHDFGGFCYRFWSKSIPRTRKRNVIKKSKELENSYHLYIQMALISQGLINILAIKHSDEVWNINSSWIRTIRPGIVPSSSVVRIVFRERIKNLNQLPLSWINIKKFITNRREVDYNLELSEAV